MKAPAHKQRDYSDGDGAQSVCTFAELLRLRAERSPWAVAYRDVSDDEDGEALSYRQLDDRVRRMAGQLQKDGLAGERVLLLLPTSLDYVIAVLSCFYAGAIAVPLYPPAPNRAFSRLKAIGQDAVAKAAVVTSRGAKGQEQIAQLMDGTRMRLYETDVDDSEASASWCVPARGNDSIAYLQYTSGSTAAPKGVVVKQENLMHNCRLISRAVGWSETDLIVSWLPFFHDMGLVGSVLFSLYIGRPLVFMRPETFIMRPHRWLQAISSYRGTLAAAPNFAYDLCCQRITSKQKSRFDLSSWRVAFNGAERVRAETLRSFSRDFSGCGFRSSSFMPCYGLAEATLFVAGGTGTDRPATRRFQRAALDAGLARPAGTGCELTACGDSRGELQVVIVDPQTRSPLPEGRIGEIWVAGDSVSAGYWRRPELSDEHFLIPESWGRDRRFLRTGDLGFQLDGQLFVTGRLKELIILAGRNIAPEDVEATVEAAHPAVAANGAFAFALEEGALERLIVVAEANERVRGAFLSREVEQAVRNAVTEQNDVALSSFVLVRRNSLPRTTSGKKQRGACRQQYLDNSLQRMRTQ